MDPGLVFQYAGDGLGYGSDDDETGRDYEPKHPALELEEEWLEFEAVNAVVPGQGPTYPPKPAGYVRQSFARPLRAGPPGRGPVIPARQAEELRSELVNRGPQPVPTPRSPPPSATTVPATEAPTQSSSDGRSATRDITPRPSAFKRPASRTTSDVRASPARGSEADRALGMAIYKTPFGGTCVGEVLKHPIMWDSFLLARDAGKRQIEATLDKDRATKAVKFIGEAEELYLTSMPPYVAAKESEGLWEITASINGVAFNAIIDTGATICVVSADLWKAFNTSIQPGRKTRMRDANGGETSTKGALVNEQITIGGEVFIITLQVIENPPFDCLLGVPFCKHASASLIFSADDLQVRLHNPNSNVEILVPAQPRGANRATGTTALLQSMVGQLPGGNSASGLSDF